MCAACGGSTLETALDVKDATRKPDGVLLEPAPAVPNPEERGKAQEGVVALRQPISDEQIGELARDYVRAYAAMGQAGTQVSTLLTDDAVLFGDNGRSSPRPQLVSWVTQRWQQHVQDYRQLHKDIVRADRLERWGHEDIGPHSDPPRPTEMRSGDVFARVPLDPVASSAGDPLFRNTLVLLVRRAPDRKLKIAGLAETDTP
jgi:hypothetical protein